MPISGAPRTARRRIASAVSPRRVSSSHASRWGSSVWSRIARRQPSQRRRGVQAHGRMQLAHNATSATVGRLAVGRRPRHRRGARASPPPRRAQGDPTMPLSQVQRGMHCTALVGRPRDRHLVVRRRGAGRHRRRARRRRAHPDPRQRAGGRRDRDRPGLLRLADLLPGRRRRPARHRRDLRGRSASTATRTALATPIEQMLGEPVEPPAAARACARAAPRRHAPSRLPLTISGVSAPLAARDPARRRPRRARPSSPGPRRPRQADPVPPLRSGLGVRGRLLQRRPEHGRDRHRHVRRRRPDLGLRPPARLGRAARDLFLQGAYVYDVINNPLRHRGRRDLQARGADRQTSARCCGDGIDAVTGRTAGRCRTRSRSTVSALDQDTRPPRRRCARRSPTRRRSATRRAPRR